MNIATNVKQARKTAGLTQRDLADMLGVSPGMICAIEVGRANPSLDVFRRLCAVLGVTAEALWSPARRQGRPPGRKSNIDQVSAEK